LHILLQKKGVVFLSHAIPLSTRQSAQIFASLRKAFTPLSHLHAPLHVGYVDSQTLVRLSYYTSEPQPIYLLQQGIWHVAVRGLGDKGELADAEMADFINPLEAARNLLTSARQQLDGLAAFLEQIAVQPNAAHILERCLREPETRTVWMVQQSGTRFPTEQEIDQALDQVHGHSD
jgi:hypothetical protein